MKRAHLDLPTTKQPFPGKMKRLRKTNKHKKGKRLFFTRNHFLLKCSKAKAKKQSSPIKPKRTLTCKAKSAEDWNRRLIPSLVKLCATSLTTRWKLLRGISRSVVRCNRLISCNARAPKVTPMPRKQKKLQTFKGKFFLIFVFLTYFVAAMFNFRNFLFFHLTTRTKLPFRKQLLQFPMRLRQCLPCGLFSSNHLLKKTKLLEKCHYAYWKELIQRNLIKPTKPIHANRSNNNGNVDKIKTFLKDTEEKINKNMKSTHKNQLPIPLQSAYKLIWTIYY